MTLKPTVSHSWSEGLASSPLLFRETPFRVASSDVLSAHVERRSHRDEVFAERRHGRGAEAVTDALDRTRRSKAFSERCYLKRRSSSGGADFKEKTRC